MNDHPEQPSLGILNLLMFECGFLLFAMLIGPLFRVDPLPGLSAKELATGAWIGEVMIGIVATLPMLASFLFLWRTDWRPCVRLRQVTEARVLSLLKDLSLVKIVLISAAAGICEEVFFRGLLQQGIGNQLDAPEGVIVGLVVASLLFGLFHPISLGYIVVTCTVGTYLGLLLIATGSILPSIVAHGVYDFVILGYLLKWQKRRPEPGDACPDFS